MVASITSHAHNVIVELNANEEANIVSCLMISKSVASSALSLGSCTIEWCRYVSVALVNKCKFSLQEW